MNKEMRVPVLGKIAFSKVLIASFQASAAMKKKAWDICLLVNSEKPLNKALIDLWGLGKKLFTA
jgi:hypothetical protein